MDAPVLVVNYIFNKNSDLCPNCEVLMTVGETTLE